MPTLKELRKEAGYTQAELARRIGTQELNIVRWEGGHHQPNLAHARALADALSVSLEVVADAVEAARERAADRPESN